MSKNIERLLEKLIEQNEQQNSKLPERALEEATSERTVFGQEIGMTESLETNTKILKHMVNGAPLKIVNYIIGRDAKTNVKVFYIEGKVDTTTLKRVMKKISLLEIDYMFNAEVIADELKVKGSGLFPTTKFTERFETIASDLMQGKVVIIADHTPYALVAPLLFWELFQTENEYTTSYGSFANRLMRMFGFLVTVFLPSIYVAVERFHSGSIESEVINGWFHGKEVLGAFWEMAFILFILRITFDVSLHIYKSLTIMITVLATLVVGEHALTIHLISPAGLVVAGLNQLCVFLVLVKGIVPLSTTLRWLMLIVAYFLGFSGLIVAFTLFFLWATYLKPYGIPYLTPILPFRPRELKDVLWRGNLKTIINSKHSFRE
ncbi:spore germination protein KA [Fictibacillus halophilus]|uniref:Spore germination protein KA n=1 Tax=Fictibacillus halophilus TaxID=1610490 RepID=A0ABV2LE44_9BACL|nr:spore germination protein [Fictibacillus halophilus]